MTEPYQYQLEGVDFIDSRGGRALVGDDMGLGKSFQSLLWADDNKTARPIIAVCPANVKYHWQNEALSHFGLRAEILHGRKPPKRRKEFLQHPMLIINYEIVKHWLKFLKGYKPKLLIIDEIHRVKNPNSQCSQAIRELSYVVPHVIELGGTAMENWPDELWHPLHILDPERFDNYLKFAFKHCRVKRTPWGWDFRQAKKPKRLHKLLCKYMIRRLKTDVLKELPAKTRIVIPVEMSNKREYQTAVKDFRSWLSTNAPKSANKMRRKSWKAEQVVKLGYLKRLAAKLKLPAVFDWIDDYLEETNEKLVVFGIHRAIMSALETRYKGQCVTLTGATAKNKRRDVVDQFVNDKSIRLFFGNIKAAGVGVNGLQKAASNALTIELDFKPSTHNQAIGRLDRLGQTSPVTDYVLIAKDSMEIKLCSLLQDKNEDSIAVLDGKQKKKGRELDIYDQLTLALDTKTPLF